MIRWLQILVHLANKRSFLFCQILGLIYILVIYRANFFAKFWFVDDHDILRVLMQSKNDGLTAWQLLMQTELGQWGVSTRFRPSYHLLRLTETLLFQDFSGLWYLSHLIWLQQFFSLTLFLLIRFLKWPLAVLFTLWIFSQVVWSDVFSRLGTGEAYSVLGLLFIAYGLFFTFRDDRKVNWIAYLITSLGLLVFAGSKEIFALWILMFVLITFLIFLRSLNRWQLLSLFALFCYTIWILGAIYLGTKQSQMDVLGNTVQISSRLQMISGILSLRSFHVVSFCLLIMILPGISLIFRGSSWNSVKAELTKVPVLITIFLFCAFVTNFLFYSGKWPTGMRYDYPAIFFAPVTIVIALLRYMHLLQSKRLKTFLVFIAFALAFQEVIEGFHYQLVQSKFNLYRTQATVEMMQNLVQFSQAKPQARIIFESTEVLTDYEYIFSLQTFLKFYQVKLPLFIRYHYDSNSFLPNTIQSQLILPLQKIESIQTDKIPIDCVSISVYHRAPHFCSDLYLYFNYDHLETEGLFKNRL
jgi:hypothetical protein